MQWCKKRQCYDARQNQLHEWQNSGTKNTERTEGSAHGDWAEAKQEHSYQSINSLQVKKTKCERNSIKGENTIITHSLCIVHLTSESALAVKPDITSTFVSSPLERGCCGYTEKEYWINALFFFTFRTVSQQYTSKAATTVHINRSNWQFFLFE